MTETREHQSGESHDAEAGSGADTTHLGPATIGRVLHSAAGYDLIAWLMMFGRETAFRDRVIDLARLDPGASVLDVGCGTGTLALRAKRRVGPTGRVFGIDASPAMVTRAQRKAKKSRTDVVFKTAVVEALPFADGEFDAVLSTLMLHHLPRALRREAAREMRRVLNPSGRVVVVDFAVSAHKRKGLLGRLHHKHGRVEQSEVIEVLTEAGLTVTESGALGIKDLHFATATRS
jgi:ubiquinone/menaquinone biosynthesis C-methylase UbiE